MNCSVIVEQAVSLSALMFNSIINKIENNYKNRKMNQTIYPYGQDGELPSNIGLVNDLKTGGVDKALTAEQGKVIGEIIGTSEDVVVQQESYINAGAYSYWSGLWRSSSVYTGVFIPIIGASQIKVQAAQEGSAYVLFCSYIIQANATNTSVSALDNEVKAVAADGTAEYNVPSDAAFLWCSTNSQDNRAAPTVTLLNLQATSGIYPLVESVSQDLNGLESDIRISPTTFTLAGNFGFWSNKWHSSNTHYGAFIPVEGAKSIKVTTLSKQFYGVFCTGTAQSDNSAVSVSTVDSTIKSLSANSSAIYTVPSDAKYLWYNVNYSDGRDTPLASAPSETLGLKDRVDVDESRISTLEDIVDEIAEYVTFGTDDDWLTSNNVQVFFNTVRNKAAYHNSSGHWLVDGVKCCKNPVVYYNCPDMSIIAVGGTIYGYSSGGLGGQIYKTNNFAKWEKLNSRILPYATYSNYWAPDANIIDGKIVIYFSCDNTLVVATSSTPAPEDGFTIEATFSYNNIDYCYANGVLFYGLGTIYYRTMTDYKTPSETAVTTNISGEGVMIWHHGDYYYAFTSILSSQNYQYDIRVYRSATLQNNTWEYGNVILKTTSESMLCGPGHISEIFQDNDGHYFAMMQVHIYDSGWSFRPTSIQELIVNSSGWPQFVDYQGNITTEPQLLSRAPTMPITIEK